MIAFQSKTLLYKYPWKDGQFGYFNINSQTIQKLKEWFGKAHVYDSYGGSEGSDAWEELIYIGEGISRGGELIIIKGKNKGGFLNFLIDSTSKILTGEKIKNFDLYGIYSDFNIKNYEKNCLVSVLEHYKIEKSLIK